MSKIFHAGSGVKFQNIRFQELEIVGKGKDSFFVPVSLSDSAKGKSAQDKGDSEPGGEPKNGKKFDVSPEKQIDLDAVREEAYMKGKMAGLQEAEEKMHSAVQALGAGLEQIDRLGKSLLMKSKEDMVELIMAVAEKIIRKEIEEKEEIVVNMIAGALEAAVEADEYYIKLNPEDIRIVTEMEPLFLARMKGLRRIHFIADKNISRGGCLAESKAGDADATVETQLHEIKRHLRKEIL